MPHHIIMAPPFLFLILLLLLGTTQAFRLPLPSTTHLSSLPLHSQRAGASARGGGGGKGDEREFFRLAQGKMEFGTMDQVELLLYEEHALVRRYLTQEPTRVLYSTWDAELVDRKAQDVFRLTTKPMSFVNLNLQPSIDVRLTASAAEYTDGDEEDYLLLVESLAHSMNGMEQILGQRFADSLKIEVQGKLRAVPPPAGTRAGGPVKLVGEVAFYTSGDLPLLFSLTPRPVLQGAAIAINRRIMSYAKGKFVKNLAVDFDRWARSGAEKGEGR